MVFGSQSETPYQCPYPVQFPSQSKLAVEEKVRVPPNNSLSDYHFGILHYFHTRCSHVLVFPTQYAFSYDPERWGTPLSLEFPEADDGMHDPKETVVDEQLWHKRGWGVSYVRGVANLGCLVIMILAVVMLLCVSFCHSVFAGIHELIYTIFFVSPRQNSAGYPVLSHFDLTAGPPTLSATFLNATSQYPGLIDTDTPSWAYTKTSWHDGSELQLVFSDEFEKEGRTFSEGDDPYWEAVNLHYWVSPFR